MSYTTDYETGLLVRAELVKAGVETPFKPKAPSKDVLEKLMVKFLKEFGLDLTDDSLKETPKRIAKLYVDEYFAGLDYDNFPKATVVENKMGFDEMIIERNITLNSLCEHHFLPIVGHAHIAYIPKQKVLGISKLNRITEFFSRRPQIQERLTLQIYYALSTLLETEDIAVVIEAEHMCVKTRGVEDACSDTVTSKVGGAFKEGTSRMEFLTFINK